MPGESPLDKLSVLTIDGNFLKFPETLVADRLDLSSMGPLCAFLVYRLCLQLECISILSNLCRSNYGIPRNSELAPYIHHRAPMLSHSIPVNAEHLSVLECHSLFHRFLRYFLYNNGQLSEQGFMAGERDLSLPSECSQNPPMSSCFETLQRLEKDLVSLASYPVDQFLIILGANTSRPVRAVLLDFTTCISTYASDDGVPARQKFAPFFQSLTVDPKFREFLSPTAPTRTHVYFRAKKDFQNYFFIPHQTFKLPSLKNLHILCIVPALEDTMELSSCDTTADVSKNPARDITVDDDEQSLHFIWFSCPSVVKGSVE
ncbi:hypothetical protein SprV_0802571300 [Sparganum proliferum]